MVVTSNPAFAMVTTLPRSTDGELGGQALQPSRSDRHVGINDGAVPEIDGHVVCIGAGVIIEADQVWSVQDRYGLGHRRRGRVGQCECRCVDALAPRR